MMTIMITVHVDYTRVCMHVCACVCVCVCVCVCKDEINIVFKNELNTVVCVVL